MRSLLVFSIIVFGILSGSSVSLRAQAINVGEPSAMVNGAKPIGADSTHSAAPKAALNAVQPASQPLSPALARNRAREAMRIQSAASANSSVMDLINAQKDSMTAALTDQMGSIESGINYVADQIKDFLSNAGGEVKGAFESIGGTISGWFSLPAYHRSQNGIFAATHDTTITAQDGVVTTGSLAAPRFVVLQDLHAGGSNTNNSTIQVPVTLAQSTVLTIPDPGAATANFVLDKGAQTIAGNKTFSGATSLAGLTASTVSTGRFVASSVGTAAASDAGVTVTDVPAFIITAGTPTADFALTMPASPVSGDAIVVVNQNSSWSATLTVSAIVVGKVLPFGSRTFVYSGSHWN